MRHAQLERKRAMNKLKVREKPVEAEKLASEVINSGRGANDKTLSEQKVMEGKFL